MNLDELTRRVGGKLLTTGKPIEVQIDQIYAGDRISDLLWSARPARTRVPRGWTFRGSWP